MTHHCIPPSPSPQSHPGVAAHPPPMVLDPQRRMLFIQRLAILMQRLRPVTPRSAKEDVPDDY